MRRLALVAVLAALPVAVALAQAPETAPTEPAAVVPPAGIAQARARLAAAEAAWAARPDADTTRDFAAAIRAVEAALGDLRGGIGGVGGEVRAMRVALAVDRAETRRLMAALATMARHPDGARVHPDGPVAAARAAAMLGPARAALAAEAAALRRRLEALAAAERLEAGGAAALAEAAAAAAAARERLRLALVAEAEPGPPAPDSAAAALVRESETLSGLAARVAGAPTGSGPARMSARNAPGEATVVPLIAPVVGIVQRGFAEPDAGGVRHPGLTLATLPRALVTAPAGGVVRYVGPFLDYGRVAVIEIAPATVVVLAGIEAMAVSAGDPVAAGEPIGFLGGRDPAPQDYLMATGHGSDAFTRETIYMEVWQQTEPVDPEPWLAAGSG